MEVYVVIKETVQNKWMETGVRIDGIYSSEAVAANRVVELEKQGYTYASYDLYTVKE
jgi:hypothetical protein